MKQIWQWEPSFKLYLKDCIFRSCHFLAKLTLKYHNIYIENVSFFLICNEVKLCSISKPSYFIVREYGKHFRIVEKLWLFLKLMYRPQIPENVWFLLWVFILFQIIPVQLKHLMELCMANLSQAKQSMILRIGMCSTAFWTQSWGKATSYIRVKLELMKMFIITWVGLPLTAA